MVASLISFYEFTVIGATTSDIVSRSLPATVASLQLAERATSLVSSAPRLMAAVDDKTRIETVNEITRQSKELDEGIERLRALVAPKTGEIDATRAALNEQLSLLIKRLVTEIKYRVKGTHWRPRLGQSMKRC